MNKKNTLYISLIIIVCITLYIGFIVFTPASPLTILLRCDQHVSGSLSIETLTNISNNKKIVDVKSACTQGEIIFDPYKDKQSIKFTLQQSEQQTELTSHYGPNIQVDKDNSVYMLLKITHTPPFIMNDRI